MGQSLSKIYLHIVFSTKNRIKWIIPTIEERVHKYLSSICEKNGCHVLAIGGMEDHIHLLVMQSKALSSSKLLEVIKANSSKWIKSLENQFEEFSWQTGYGVFSVDQSNFEAVRTYIENQKEHHKKRTFKEEYLLILKKCGVEYDEKYIWE